MESLDGDYEIIGDTCEITYKKFKYDEISQTPVVMNPDVFVPSVEGTKKYDEPVKVTCTKPTTTVSGYGEFVDLSTVSSSGYSRSRYKNYLTENSYDYANGETSFIKHHDTDELTLLREENNKLREENASLIKLIEIYEKKAFVE